MNLFSDLDDPELAGDEKLAALVQEIGAYATGPAPEARPALMAVLTRGLAGLPAHAGAPVPTAVVPRARLGERLQTSRARLVLAAAVASVGFLSSGAAGALPGPAQSAFARAATAVGIELPEEAAASDAGPSEPLAEPPAGGGTRQDQANDGATTSGRPTQPPAVSVDDRVAGGADPGEVPPASTGGDTNSGGVPSRGARGEGAAGRPLPAPNPPGRPEVGLGGPLDGAPRPAAPGPPELTDGGRAGGVPGRADGGDEQDEEGPGRPEIRPGALPGNPGHGPNVPAPAGGHNVVPPR